MPVMDGHEAIRRIRAAAGGMEPKIIAVTASALDENRQELLGIGADDFIGKPFQAVELFQKIHAHLGVEYLYAEEDADAAQEEVAELTPESLARLPQDLIHQMREAVIGADLDQLLAKIREVEARDPRTAHGLRDLAEHFEYETLLDLFGPGVTPATPRDLPAPGPPPSRLTARLGSGSRESSRLRPGTRWVVGSFIVRQQGPSMHPENLESGDDQPVVPEAPVEGGPSPGRPTSWWWTTSRPTSRS